MTQSDFNCDVTGFSVDLPALLSTSSSTRVEAISSPKRLIGVFFYEGRRIRGQQMCTTFLGNDNDAWHDKHFDKGGLKNYHNLFIVFI